MKWEQGSLPTVGIVSRESGPWAALQQHLTAQDFHALWMRPQELLVGLDELHPDVLLLDSLGTDTPALEICRLIQQNPRWSNLDLVAVCPLAQNEAFFLAGCALVLPPSLRDNPALWPALLRWLELRSHEDELAQLQESVEQQAEAMREQRKNYAVFAGTLSHEVRTPLGVIEGFVINLLDELEGELNDLQRQSLSIVQKNIQRLKQYLGEILDHSKLEVKAVGEVSRSAGRETPRRVFRRRLLPLTEVAEEVVELFREQFRRHNLALQVYTSPELPRLWMDRSKIRQVLVNLLSNALKFTPAGGAVKVRVEALNANKEPLAEGDPHAGRSRAYVGLAVQDTGVGIPAEQIGALFEQFVRVEGAVEPVEGSGLGLAICRQIIEEHGGEIAVESIEGQGSTFRLVLPVDLRRRRLGKLYVADREDLLLVWLSKLQHNLEEVERISTLEDVDDMLSRGCLDVMLLHSPHVAAFVREKETQGTE